MHEAANILAIATFDWRVALISVYQTLFTDDFKRRLNEVGRRDSSLWDPELV